MSTALSLVNKDEVVSLKEAADLLGITYSGILHLLSNRPEFRDEHTFKMKYQGRRKTVITKHGLFILGYSKDGDRGNDKKHEPGSAFAQKKQEVTAAFADLADDPIISMRMKQLQIEREVSMLSKRTDDIEEVLDEGSKKEITPLQRQRLNDRVRGLAASLKIQYSTAWRHVHTHVGKSSINDYEFKDYAVANKLLKGLYKKNELPWLWEENPINQKDLQEAWWGLERITYGVTLDPKNYRIIPERRISQRANLPNSTLREAFVREGSAKKYFMRILMDGLGYSEKTAKQEYLKALIESSEWEIIKAREALMDLDEL